MSYQELLAFCYGQSIVLSAVLSAVITYVLFRITSGKRKGRKHIIAEVVCAENSDDLKTRNRRNKLMTDFLSGKFDIK